MQDTGKSCKKRKTQHEAWEGALKDYRHHLTTQPMTTAQSVIQLHYISSFDIDWYRTCSIKQSYVQHCMKTLFDISQDSSIQESTKEAEDTQTRTE